MDTFEEVRAQIANIHRYLVELGTDSFNAAQQAQGVVNIGTANDVSGGGGGSASPADKIKESQVIFDPDTGHDHSAGVATAVPLVGDVTGTNQADSVAQLQGVTLTLVSPVTGQVISYNGTAWVNTSTIAGPLTVTGVLMTEGRKTTRSANGVVADVTVVNSAVETLLFTAPVPANDMAVGITYRASAFGRYTVSGGGTFTIRFKMGGVTFLTVVSSANSVTNQEWSAQFVVTCRTTGVTGTVISQAWIVSSNAISSQADSTTHTVDTTAAQDITITGQWSVASAGDSLTLAQGFLEVVA
jgi:hypothetical protein